MKKILFVLFTVSLMLVSASGVMAYTYTDNTLAQEWKEGAVLGSGTWEDVIGNPGFFDTFGANWDGSTLSIFTNWKPSFDGKVVVPAVTTADLFIGSYGKFDYAIGMGTNNMGKIYATPTYVTSNDIFKTIQKTSGDYVGYGGMYDKKDPKLVPVLATSSSTGWTSVNWKAGEVDIDLSFLGYTPNFVWGTATCGNDVFAHVPLSPSVLMLAPGLLGLFGMRRKKAVA